MSEAVKNFSPSGAGIRIINANTIIPIPNAVPRLVKAEAWYFFKNTCGNCDYLPAEELQGCL